MVRGKLVWTNKYSADEKDKLREVKWLAQINTLTLGETASNTLLHQPFEVEIFFTTLLQTRKVKFREGISCPNVQG